MSIIGRTEKSNVLHTPSPPHTEHYAAFGRSGVLTHATTWMPPEDLMPGWALCRPRRTRMKSRRMVAGAWGKGLMGNLCGRGRVLVWEDEEHSGDGWWRWLHNKVNVLNANDLYTHTWLKWYISCYVYFSIKITKNRGLPERRFCVSESV